MTQPDIRKELRTCKNSECKKEYEASIMNLLGARIVRGGGYCPDCAKKLFEREEAMEKGIITPEEINRQRRLWRLRCGIPPKFANEDFSTFEKDRQPKAFKKCWDYAENYPLGAPQSYPSLVLFSEHSWGVGKTHLVCSIAHRILDRWNGERINCPVLFISEPDLYMRIQATYNYSLEEKYSKEDESDIISHLTSAGLLILDDVGKRRVHDPRFVQRIMFSVIDGRYKAMLPIVLTANLNPEQLKVYLGGGEKDEASFDRLLEMTGGMVRPGVIRFLKLEGDSFRRK
jgi:DNA replication protein DnaC